jgi:DNA polymerase-3 subunit alpha
MFELGGFDAPQLGSVLHPVPEDMENIPQREMLGWEKELAGTYLSNHPMQRYMPQIKAAKTTMLGEVDESMNGQQVTVAGLINFVRHHQTKKGDAMAFVEIEDIQAAREIVVFPKAFSAHRDLLINGKLIVVKGKVDAPDGRPAKILADSISNEITTYGAIGEVKGAYETAPPPAKSLFEPPPEPAPSKSVQVQSRQNNHTNGANGANGKHAANGHTAEPAVSAPPSAPPPPPSPPPEPELLTEPPATQNSTGETGHQLHITIPRSGNLSQDKHRMKMAYQLLTQNPGDDRFVFYIPNGNKRVQIDFPNQTTRYTAHLEQQLVQMLGATAVRVD